MHKSIENIEALGLQNVVLRVDKLEAENCRLTEQLQFIKDRPERDGIERRDPKMEPPPEFSGKQAEFSLFSTRLAAFLAAQPHTYTDDVSKIMYTASRLTGVAADWFQSYLDKHINESLHYADFRSEFEVEFKDPLVKQRAQNELLNLT